MVRNRKFWWMQLFLDVTIGIPAYYFGLPILALFYGLFFIYDAYKYFNCKD